MCTCRASGGYSGCTLTIIFVGRRCPPQHMGRFGLTEGGGLTGLAAVFSTPPITPPSTPPICPPGTPPGTAPATPPKLSGSRGASLISAMCFGITVGAKIFPAFISVWWTTFDLITAPVGGGGGGGGGGGATSLVDANCWMLRGAAK